MSSFRNSRFPSIIVIFVLVTVSEMLGRVVLLTAEPDAARGRSVVSVRAAHRGLHGRCDRAVIQEQQAAPVRHVHLTQQVPVGNQTRSKPTQRAGKPRFGDILPGLDPHHAAALLLLRWELSPTNIWLPGCRYRPLLADTMWVRLVCLTR